MNFDWNELAFDSKKPVDKLGAVFILAPRRLSTERFTQLIKTYLPQGNLLIGLAKEPYVEGYENQAIFEMLRLATIQPIIDKVNAKSPSRKIFTLSYFQRDAKHILGQLQFQKVLLVNGSWKYSFHTRPEYYVLANRQIPYEHISPFTSEKEAQEYADSMALPETLPTGTYDESGIMQLVASIATHSFDYSFQTGATLAKKTGVKYQVLLQSYNRVVPYQTYAMHHGASREQHFTPSQDLNYYDANHAEIELLIQAAEQKIDLKNTSLFINLLPCPTCARMLSRTPIAEIVYTIDHSEGYAVKLLEATGKTVRRLVL